MASGAGMKAGLAAIMVAVIGAGGAVFFGEDAETQQTAPTPRATIAPVDWEAAEEDASAQGTRARPQDTLTGAAGGLGDGSAGSTRLVMPLLLPKSLLANTATGRALTESLSLQATEYQYSAEAKDGARTYLVQGTRYVFEVEEVDEVAATIDPEAISVETLEYGIEATFERYGVFYSVAILCDEPQSDPQCTEEDTVRRLAADMTLVR